jgi:hypothetical protein
MSSPSLSKAIDIDNRFSEGLWRFLRQVVPDAPFQDSVRVLLENFLAYNTGSGCGAIGIAFKRDGGHRDDWSRRKLSFKLVVLRLFLSQPQPPTVVMDHHTDMIRVVECLRRLLERRVVKTPLRGRGLPNELGKLVSVFVVPPRPRSVAK